MKIAPLCLTICAIVIGFPLDVAANVRFACGSDLAEVTPDWGVIQDPRAPIQYAISHDQATEFVHRLKVTITNTTNADVAVSKLEISLGGELETAADTKMGFGAEFYTWRHAFIDDPAIEQTTRLAFESLPQSLPSASWFGWANRFNFEAVRFQAEQRLPEPIINASEVELDPLNVHIALAIPAERIEAGVSHSFEFEYISGVKSRVLLAHPDVGLEGILLLNLWDWFRAFCLLLWAIIDVLFQVTGSWGLALIALALVIRIFTYPITRFSIRNQEISLKQQADIAPELARVKQEYSGIKQSEQLVKLYETQHYDQLAPFKSMMGLMVQIPIFAALFNLLGELTDLQGQSFLWISDLSSSDQLWDWGVDLPYFGSYLNLLPFIMGGIVVLSTWVSARHSGRKRTSGLALFGWAGVFFVMFYSFPAALVLYWLSSNLFQLVQQILENRYLRT